MMPQIGGARSILYQSLTPGFVCWVGVHDACPVLLVFFVVVAATTNNRALMYHSRMLQAAKRISNLNEFVYLAKEISRMLKEEVRQRDKRHERKRHEVIS